MKDSTTAGTSILRGWKEIAARLKVSVDTAHRKHDSRPMPLCRDNPKEQPLVLVVDLEQWVREGYETRRRQP